mgnify:CR=1 FL=1
MEKQEKNETPSSIINTLNITFDQDFHVHGVTNVLECTDKNFVAFLGDNTLAITGDGLSIEFVDIDRKQAHVNGHIHVVKFTQGKSKLSLLKKLVK